MTKYDICAIGNALVDYEINVQDKFFLDNSIEKGLMTLVDSERQKSLLDQVSNLIEKKQGGGSAANSVVALSQLGGKGYYSCKVADDEDGIFYLKDLHDLGLHTSLDGKTLPKGDTGRCLIMITPDAERTMNTALGITADFSTQELNPEAIIESKFLFIEGYLVSSDTGYEAAIQARDIAKANNVKTAITFSDPSMVKYFHDRMKNLVKEKMDLLFCNEEEALLFTGEENLVSAKNRLQEVAEAYVITMGERGSLIWDGNDFIEIEPFSTKAVDTTGAGDMFAGAFLYGVTNGLSFEKAGILASRASSEVVSQFGPRLSPNQLKQIKETILR
jgi:sugar/nucleoside kinase (ribokinase family)